MSLDDERASVPPRDASVPRSHENLCVILERWFIEQMLGTATELEKDVFWTGTVQQVTQAVIDSKNQTVKLLMAGDCEGIAIPPPCDDECCTPYPPLSDIIAFAPNDLRYNPDYRPEGYAAAPWYDPDQFAPGVSFPDIQENDVLFDWTRVTANPLTFNPVSLIYSIVKDGFPRFTVYVNGTGTVELHLLKVPFGGLALITLDSNPLSAGIVEMSTATAGDLDSWLSVLSTIVGGITGTLIYEDIIEIDITEPGEHHITVTMLPTFSPDSLLGWGGGLREVVLCGDLSIGDSFMPDFRINGTDLEWQPNPGTNWINLGRVVGFDGEDGAQGIPGECPPCPQDVGYGEPVNIDYYCRAARVLAEGLFTDIYNAIKDSADATTWEFIPESIEAVLPFSLKSTYASNDGFPPTINTGAWNLILTTYETHNDWLAVIQQLKCIMLPYFRDNPPTLQNIFDNSPTELNSMDEYLTLFYDGFVEMTAGKAELLAYALLFPLVEYISLHPSSFRLAAYWEANLSAVTGVEDCDACINENCEYNYAELGTPTASSTQSGLYIPANAIDGNTAPGQESRWQSATGAGALPAWYMLEFNTPQTVQKINVWDTLFGGAIWTGSFQIKLNAGDAWETIADVADLIAGGEQYKRTLTLIAPSNEFKFFRVTIDSVLPTGTWASIVELELFACTN